MMVRRRKMMMMRRRRRRRMMMRRRSMIVDYSPANTELPLLVAGSVSLLPISGKPFGS